VFEERQIWQHICVLEQLKLLVTMQMNGLKILVLASDGGMTGLQIMGLVSYFGCIYLTNKEVAKPYKD
jgi:hypothetical protein